MRHDLHLYGQTSQGEKCEAEVSIWADDDAGYQRELDWWKPRAAWFLKKPGYPDVPPDVKVVVERVERIEISEQQFQPMPLPPGLAELFNGMLPH